MMADPHQQQRLGMEEQVVPDGGITRRVDRGGTGPFVKVGSLVTAHYVGRLRDGTVFDSTRDRHRPVEFRQGDGQVIKGLELALEGMREGDQAHIVLSADYAYGSFGSLPTVPPNCTLEYDLEIIQVVGERSTSTINDAAGAGGGVVNAESEYDDESRDIQEFELAFEERLSRALNRKDLGNEFFKQGRYDLARWKYEKALEALEPKIGLTDEEVKRARRDVDLPCLLNLAACSLKLEDFRDTIDRTTRALDIDSLNIKALFRQSQAHSGMGNYDEAQADLAEALRIAPQNKEIQSEIARLEKRVVDFKNKEKHMFSQLFSDTTRTTQNTL